MLFARTDPTSSDDRSRSGAIESVTGPSPSHLPNDTVTVSGECCRETLLSNHPLNSLIKLYDQFVAQIER